MDFNRSGAPLVEIVSAPDLRSGAEAAAYVREVRSLLARCGASDGRMEDGSLRVDVNVSVSRAGDAGLREKAEIKNLNSLRAVRAARDSASESIPREERPARDIFQLLRLARIELVFHDS